MRVDAHIENRVSDILTRVSALERAANELREAARANEMNPQACDTEPGARAEFVDQCLRAISL